VPVRENLAQIHLFDLILLCKMLQLNLRCDILVEDNRVAGW